MNLFRIIMYPVLTFFTYKKYGYQRENKTVEKVTIQLSVILILAFIILTNLSGLYFGFLKNPIIITPFKIFKNTYGILIVAACQEYIRYMIAKHNKKKLIAITFLFIISDIFFITKNTLNNYTLFVDITTLIIPSIFRNILCSYLSGISPKPGIIFRGFFEIYGFIFPLYPNYGNYITSIINIVMPFLLYTLTEKYIKKYEKTKKSVSLKKTFWFFNVPIFSLLLILFVLTTGLFKYKIMAIGSNSMKPKINYGDIVIFEKTDSYKKNDIIVFVHNNNYIVHRIFDIEYIDDDIIIQTKGDANNTIDSYKVKKNDVIGVVKTNIRYIGLPTIFINEIINIQYK